MSYRKSSIVHATIIYFSVRVSLVFKHALFILFYYSPSGSLRGGRLRGEKAELRSVAAVTWLSRERSRDWSENCTSLMTCIMPLSFSCTEPSVVACNVHTTLTQRGCLQGAYYIQAFLWSISRELEPSCRRRPENFHVRKY